MGGTPTPGPNLVHEIELFFISYNAAKGKEFAVRGRSGPDRARELVEAAERRFARAAKAVP